jgi:4-diphosphocytidyl-2-C-methyl-D-erythritol kinase
MRIVDDGKSILVRSPAKLNLSLAIRGRRSDGFHEIETVMVKIGLFDALHFTPRTDAEISLTVRRLDSEARDEIPAGPTNLVIRAAEALRLHAGIRYGADIVLEKRIPAEAGLAGGSGNAAAALAGLNRLWKLGFRPETLREIGSTLGSDIPFFLSSSTAAIARGRGEQIAAVPTRGPLHFVVIKPTFGLSTAGVYREFAAGQSFSNSTAGSLISALARRDLGLISQNLQNDLEPAAERIAPQIHEIRGRLIDECRFGAMMTGSGSACFGMCGTAREAWASAARLRAAGIGQVFASMTA